MNTHSTPRVTRRGRWLGAALLAVAALTVPVVTTGAAAVPAAIEIGDSVYIGSKVGYGGTGAFPVWSTLPPTGDPDLWAYCVEHDIPAETGLEGTTGELDGYLGSNFLTDPIVQGKVLWVLTHSYPALTLAEFGSSVGVPGISLNDALEATQYAIWRYTELDYDAAWNFETPDSATAYWALLSGANASSGVNPADLAVTADITAPTSDQIAATLVGPFTVATNQPTVTVSADPDVAIVDANGDAIDPTAVVDGQELYLDLRETTTAGSATITVTATGSNATGKIVSVPKVAGETPTVEVHAQTIIMVAPANTVTTAAATAGWSAVSTGAPTQTTAPTQPGTSHQAGTSNSQLASTGFDALPGLLAVALLVIAAGVAPQLVRRRS